MLLLARLASSLLRHTSFDFSISRVTVHDLVFEIGRPSAISTRSPFLYSPDATCAWYLLERVIGLAHEGVLHPALDREPSPSSACWSLTTRPTSLRWFSRRASRVASLLTAARSFCLPFLSAPCARARCRCAACVIWLVLDNCCVASCMRRPNCAFSSSVQLLLQLVCRLAAKFALASIALSQHAVHEDRCGSAASPRRARRPPWRPQRRRRPSRR